MNENETGAVRGAEDIRRDAGDGRSVNTTQTFGHDSDLSFIPFGSDLTEAELEHGIIPRFRTVVQAQPDRVAVSDEAGVKALQGWRRDLFGEQALAERFQRIAERREHAHPCDYYPLALNHV